VTTTLTTAKLTRRERIEATLAAVADVQRRCNAFTAIRPDDALAEADALDRLPPDDRGSLHGVPVAVKDLFDVAGLPTTGSCAAYRDHVARNDAAVKALVAAGAVVVAKTN
jgi:Asp-tRNA(Asn)/Glu-tRNA(Gln) amidotransferase A subunit family amidase